MRARAKLSILCILLLTIASQYTVASATNIYRFQGKGADAYFVSRDASGCIVTRAEVAATDQSSMSPTASKDYSSFAFVAIYQYDECNNQDLLAGSGIVSLTGSEFQVAGNLNSATLNVTVPIMDSVSNSSFDVTVSITWTAVGDRIHDTTHFNSKLGKCHFSRRTNGETQFAQASGSISDGVTNFAVGTSQGAAIYVTKAGELSHGCE